MGHVIEAAPRLRARTGGKRLAGSDPSARALPGPRIHDFLLLVLTRDGRVMDPAVLEKIERLLPSATDCFVFCHGWLTDLAEARAGASRFFGSLEPWLKRLEGRMVPLRVALHWPSKPFADHELTETGAHDGLSPEVERWVLRFHRGERQGIERLLRDLIEGEVPRGPEEEAELDELFRSLRDARGDFLLSPFHALSFWVMKRRAGEVGERFAREHWAPLWERLPSRPRLHLCGHSFGARLLTSALLGGMHPESLVLLQAAFSAFAFAPEVPGYDRPGFFHRVLAERRVAGPIVALRSIHDTALRALYPLLTGSGQMDRQRGACGQAVRRPGAVQPTGLGRSGKTCEVVAKSAIGAVGIRGVGAPEVELRAVQRMGLPQRPVVNVDGSRVVRARDLVVGAHGDIYHPEIGALVLMAAGLLQGHLDGPRPRPVEGRP